MCLLIWTVFSGERCGPWASCLIWINTQYGPTGNFIEFLLVGDENTHPWDIQQKVLAFLFFYCFIFFLDRSFFRNSYLNGITWSKHQKTFNLLKISSYMYGKTFWNEALQSLTKSLNDIEINLKCNHHRHWTNFGNRLTSIKSFSFFMGKIDSSKSFSVLCTMCYHVFN